MAKGMQSNAKKADACKEVRSALRDVQRYVTQMEKGEFTAEMAAMCILASISVLMDKAYSLVSLIEAQEMLEGAPEKEENNAE